MTEILRAGRGVRSAAFCSILVLAAFAARLDAQTACRPAKELRVCQDTYGQADNRVFIAWTNGETTYSSIEISVDGQVIGDVPGSARLAYVDDLAPGAHTFGVRGICGAESSAEATKAFQVVTATPHDRPVDSLGCTFDAARGRWTVTFDLGEKPSLFIDVYRRQAGNFFLDYVGTVFGDSTTITVNGRSTDRLFFQFFDEDCYGSELLSCPGPACVPVAEVRVCQDIYGASRGRVFVLWSPGASSYTAFDVLLDGQKVGSAGGLSGQLYVDPVAPGAHTFEVQGICGAESAGPVAHAFTVLDASPHTAPLENLRCSHDAMDRTLSATWLPGAQPSAFIDVYLRLPGQSLLDYRGTARGDTTRVDVTDANADDELVLQFFNGGCYGSPLITCSEGPGGGFIRGDSDGSGDVDISDASSTLNFLFLGSRDPLCFDAADANDDSQVDIADPVFVLGWLFRGDPEPPAPGALACGADPTADTLPPCLTAVCD